MCTYPISLDDSLVMQAESVFGINDSFQSWLQHHVEMWLSDQVSRKGRHRARRGQLSDEMLAERLKEYPPLEEDCFPNLAAEDYGVYLKSRSGRFPKGLEQWL